MVTMCKSGMDCPTGQICCAAYDSGSTVVGECVAPAVQQCGPQCPNGATQLCTNQGGLLADCALQNDAGLGCQAYCASVSPPPPPVRFLDGGSGPGDSMQAVCNY
jgi:hypothetical protein